MVKKIALFIVATVVAALMFIAVPHSEAGKASYISVKKCKGCHIKQFKSWQETKMAKAFDLLKPGERADAKTKAKLDPKKDYTTDSTCLPCHTTGYGEPGGFKDIGSSPDLAGVTCESCHGAGSEYTKDDKMSFKNKEYKKADVVAAGLISPPTEAVCTKCHNEKSPFMNKGDKFDFEARKKQGTHEHTPLKYKHD